MKPHKTEKHSLYVYVRVCVLIHKYIYIYSYRYAYTYTNIPSFIHDLQWTIYLSLLFYTLSAGDLYLIPISSWSVIT